MTTGTAEAGSSISTPHVLRNRRTTRAGMGTWTMSTSMSSAIALAGWADEYYSSQVSYVDYLSEEAWSRGNQHVTRERITRENLKWKKLRFIKRRTDSNTMGKKRSTTASKHLRGKLDRLASPITTMKREVTVSRLRNDVLKRHPMLEGNCRRV
jgi:hypothetical protein